MIYHKIELNHFILVYNIQLNVQEYLILRYDAFI